MASNRKCGRIHCPQIAVMCFPSWNVAARVCRIQVCCWSSDFADHLDRIAGSTLPGAVQLAFNGTQLILLTNRAGASGSELVVYDLMSMQQLQSCSVTMPDSNDSFNSESKVRSNFSKLCLHLGYAPLPFGDSRRKVFGYLWRQKFIDLLIEKWAN